MRQVFFSYDDLMMSIQNGAITMFCWLFTVKERGIEEKKIMAVRYCCRVDKSETSTTCQPVIYYVFDIEGFKNMMLVNKGYFHQ